VTPVDQFLAEVLAQKDAPYIWAGKGASVAGRPHKFVNASGLQILVFDCSGLVTWALKRCGWKTTREFNCHGMWMHWRRTDKPKPGDLIIYGQPDRASHVEVLMPDGHFFGAIGGNSKTKSVTWGACVQWRLKDRKDKLGFLVNPLRPDDAPAAS
jgi:cell wall-associated NlpC family hydrolase